MSQQNENIQQKSQMNTQDIERQEEIDRKLDEISNKITEDVCALYYNKLQENFLDQNLQTKIEPITRFLAQTLNVQTTNPKELLANLSARSTEEQARIFQKLEAQFPNIFKSEQTNINSQIDKYEQDIKDIIAAKDDAAKNAQSNDKIGRSIEKNIQYYEAEYERLKKEYLNSIFGGIREIFRMQSTAMKKVAKKMKEQRNLKEMQIKDSTESIKTALGVKSDGANGFYFDGGENTTYNASRMADKIIQNKLDKINNRSSIDVFSEMADVKTASSGQDLNDKRKQLLQIKDLSAKTEQTYNAKINSGAAKKAQGTSLNI